MGSIICMAYSLFALALWFSGEMSMEPGLHGLQLFFHIIDAEIAIPISGIAGSASTRELPRLSAVLILVSAVAGRICLGEAYAVAGPWLIIGTATILIAADLQVRKR